MKILSFDDNTYSINRDYEQNDLYDLFQKNISYIDTPIYIYIVPREFEMRLDRISNYIYGTPDYVEELMVLNDIISPYSVKEGQYILFCNISFLAKLYNIKDELSNKNKNYTPIKNNVSNKNTNKNIQTSNNYKDQIKVTKEGISIVNNFK